MLSYLPFVIMFSFHSSITKDPSECTSPTVYSGAPVIQYCRQTVFTHSHSDGVVEDSFDLFLAGVELFQKYFSRFPQRFVVAIQLVSHK